MEQTDETNVLITVSEARSFLRLEIDLQNWKGRHGS